jgi:hypothetical protein
MRISCLVFIAFLSIRALYGQPVNKIGTYNFGINQETPENQIIMLQNMGYQSLFFRIYNKAELNNLKALKQLTSNKYPDFAVESVYYPCRPVDTISNFWKQIINELQGTEISFSLIMKDFSKGETMLKVSEIANYALTKNVEVVLYPHAGTNITSAEQALNIIKELGNPKNLTLSFHLCHEIRAGNENRLAEVAKKIKGHIALTTISGASNTKIHSDQWDDVIQPLAGSEFDLSIFTSALKAIQYKGPIMVHTFGIKIKPEMHLKSSIAVLKSLLKE